ncbi:MCE family protein, partial [Mycobacterium sp.]|uniref:MCE family protein n=1 Tax=Mycobacterium sp. TaxID=1785 RepID=UPI003C74B8AA
MTMNRRTLRRVTAISLVGTLAVASFLVGTKLWKDVEKNTYSAYFAESNGLFVGDEIRILGVAVGVVDKIEPQPTDSKVTFSVDKQYPVPADARAAILSPSLVTPRAIQLVPAYSGGPKLSPGASIPLNRTAVPVEWDDFRKQLEKLTDALQPTGPGGVNSVGEFINSAADNLRGQGDTARDTVIKLSQAISALGDHADDIFSTVRNLQLLVSALYSSSDLLASFNQNLASVTTVLSNTPNEVANAVRGLDQALADLREFLSDNREAMGVTFDRLNSITTALNDSRGDIKQILHVAPTVIQNFMNIYQPAQSAMTGIIALNNFADIPQFICSSIEAASRARLARVSKLCLQYINPIIKNRIYNY